MHCSSFLFLQRFRRMLHLRANDLRRHRDGELHLRPEPRLPHRLQSRHGGHHLPGESFPISWGHSPAWGCYCETILGTPCHFISKSQGIFPFTLLHFSQFTISKCDTSVCQLRLDYESFDIANPVSNWLSQLLNVYYVLLWLEGLYRTYTYPVGQLENWTFSYMTEAGSASSHFERSDEQYNSVQWNKVRT